MRWWKYKNRYKSVVRVSPALNDQAEKQTLVRGDLEAVP